MQLILLAALHHENMAFRLILLKETCNKMKNFEKYTISMSCFIEVSNDITKLKQYDIIEKNQSLQIVISETEFIMVLTL